MYRRCSFVKHSVDLDFSAANSRVGRRMEHLSPPGLLLVMIVATTAALARGIQGYGTKHLEDESRGGESCTCPTNSLTTATSFYDWWLYDAQLDDACGKMLQPEKVDEDLRNAAVEHQIAFADQCRPVDAECRPMPNVMRLSQLCHNVSIPLELENEYASVRTILYRCPSLSCCSEDHFCQRKTSVIVNQPFLLRIKGGKEQRMVTLSFRNDTECECRTPFEEKMENIIEENKIHENKREEKCPSKCPPPFVSVKGNCTCKCSSKNRTECIAIQKGQSPLSESSFLCVEQKTCRNPSCTKGRVFDLTSRKCKKAKKV